MSAFPKGSGRLLAFSALSLLACILLISGRSDSPSAQRQSLPAVLLQPTPTAVIPGMPPCGCVFACEFPPTPGAPPVPTLTTIAQANGNGGRVVALDPGHGGKETGAVSQGGLAEKDVNLKIGLKLAALLKQGGYRPVLTRDSDRQVNTDGKDLNGNGVVDNDDDLQARVDIANAAHADILVSMHNNGAPDRSQRGTQVYYCDARPFSAQSIRLAQALQSHIVASMRAQGYAPVDKGISDDAVLKKPFGHLFVLGPLTPRVARASNMPGALGETLYLSNPTEAALLADDAMLSAIARGYYEGIEEYFSSTMDDGG